MALAVGIDPSELYRWETGRRSPRGDVAERYGQVLHDLLALTETEEALALLAGSAEPVDEDGLPVLNNSLTPEEADA